MGQHWSSEDLKEDEDADDQATEVSNDFWRLVYEEVSRYKQVLAGLAGEDDLERYKTAVRGSFSLFVSSRIVRVLSPTDAVSCI
jgi:hypothetical protein